MSYKINRGCDSLTIDFIDLQKIYMQIRNDYLLVQDKSMVDLHAIDIYIYIHTSSMIFPDVPLLSLNVSTEVVNQLTTEAPYLRPNNQALHGNNICAMVNGIPFHANPFITIDHDGSMNHNMS